MKLVSFKERTFSSKMLGSICLLTFLGMLAGPLSCSLLSTNQIDISLASKTKHFGKDNTSYSLPHHAHMKSPHTPFPRHLSETRVPLETVNNTPRIDPDHYDEIVGINQVATQSTSSNKCNRQILNNYMIQGHDSPMLENHKFCPDITYNCCTRQDAKVTMENWNTGFRGKIQAYYSAYINAIRYMLGYHTQMNILAREVERRFSENITPKPFNSEGEAHQVGTRVQQKINNKCLNTAKEFLELNFDLNFATLLLNSSVQLINSLTHLRRSFFCTLCDGESQAKLQSLWLQGNDTVRQTIFFSGDFCSRFVNESVNGVYNYLFILSEYMDSMKTLVDCKLAEHTSKFAEPYSNLKFFVDNSYDVASVRECFHKKDEGIMEHCQQFCNQFNLTKINHLVDGNMSLLYKFFDFLAERKHMVFENQANPFVKDVKWTEDLIRRDHEATREMYMFFEATNQKKLLDNMNSDMVAYGGINPYDSGNDNYYQIILAHAANLSMILCSLFIAFWI